MEELKRRILSEAVVGEGDIIHVDMFLNHCMDMGLMERMGDALAKRFRETHSFVLDKTYTLRVSKKYLTEDDVVLVVDDILSNGQAILSLLELVSKAGGEVAGVAVAIEKAMRDGGRVLRRMGLRVEALATVERVEGERIILR